MFVQFQLFVVFFCFILFACPHASGESFSSDYDNDVQIEVLSKPDTCETMAENNQFAAFHFKNYYEDEPDKIVTNTYERGVPVEILIGTKMISPGLDKGLLEMCVGERRKITVPTDLSDMDAAAADKGRKVVYEVELLSVSSKMSMNTFAYLDLDGDGFVSETEVLQLIKMMLKMTGTSLGLDDKTLVDMMMAMHDRDSDRRISSEEFRESLEESSDRDDGMRDEL